MSKPTDMIKVYYWADGTWCYADEYSEQEYSWKSDDFGTAYFHENYTDEEITQFIYEELI